MSEAVTVQPHEPQKSGLLSLSLAALGVVSAAMLAALALPALTLSFLGWLVRDRGLAHAHFRWTRQRREALQAWLPALKAVLLPLYFVVALAFIRDFNPGIAQLTHLDVPMLAIAVVVSVLAAIVAGRDFHSRAGRHLQWLLGDIADGAGLMRTAPRVPGKRMGLLRVVETLNFYGREYDHPGWVVLKP